MFDKQPPLYGFNQSHKHSSLVVPVVRQSSHLGYSSYPSKAGLVLSTDSWGEVLVPRSSAVPALPSEQGNFYNASQSWLPKKGSTSVAYKGFPSWEDVCEVATWLSLHSFTRHYLIDEGFDQSSCWQKSPSANPLVRNAKIPPWSDCFVTSQT